MNIHNLKVGDKLGNGIISEVNTNGIRLNNKPYLFRWESVNRHTNKSDTWKLVRLKDDRTSGKLIGYKLKDKKYEDAAKALCSKAVHWQEGSITLGVGENISIPNLREAGVLDLWFEPVYNNEAVVSLSNNRKATIKSKSLAHIFISTDTRADINRADLDYILNVFNNLGQIAGHNVVIREFYLGCQTFTIDDLLAVDKAFRDFK